MVTLNKLAVEADVVAAVLGEEGVGLLKSQMN